jgi:cell division protein FtsB
MLIRFIIVVVIVVGIMLLLLVLTAIFAFITSARFKQINELEEEGLQELVKQSKRVKKNN